MKKQTLQLITEILKIIRNYYEQLHAKKLDNLKEMEKFLKIYNLPRLNYEEIKKIINSYIYLIFNLLYTYLIIITNQLLRFPKSKQAALLWCL